MIDPMEEKCKGFQKLFTIWKEVFRHSDKLKFVCKPSELTVLNVRPFLNVLFPEYERQGNANDNADSKRNGV